MSSTSSTPIRRRGAHPGIERRRDAGRRVRRHVRPDAAVARSHAESGHEAVRESGVGMHHRRFMPGENRHGRTLGHRTRIAVHREAARHSPGNRRQAMQPVIAKPGSEHVGRRLGQAGRRRPSIARLPRCVRRPKLSCRLAASRAAIAQAKRTERAKRAKQATSAARSAQATQPMQPMQPMQPICTAHSTIGLPPAACRLPPAVCRLPPIARHDPRSATRDQRPATRDLRTRAPAHPRSRHAISAARNPARSVCPLSFGSSFAPVIQRRQFGAPQWHSNWRISTSSVDA
ncbi:putative lipo domain protein [Burkholderia pseudomallei MSHR511]|nr:putative lipo domain protein [Burkholderia pseudomallei NAU20B-16]AHG37652.1 putative lipo domain protein [Burkholderia pseudomallei MSHR511]AHG70996.1 putative lipo domain protein [Burkholderia pseudomallei MSHR146]